MAEDMNKQASEDQAYQQELQTIGSDDLTSLQPGAEEPGEPPSPADGPSAVETVGSFFSSGAAAMNEVRTARRAHAEARDQLESLDDTIADEEEELAHRREVEANYSQIIAEQTARRDAATQAGTDAVNEQNRIQGAIDALKDQLQQMKDADAQTEKRLKAALEAAEAREASARESGARLQRRLDDAKKSLERAEREQADGVAAAQAAVQSADARLKMLREELAEVQRNPSANSAAYSVRSGELEQEIADAEHDLQLATADLPRITQELADTLENSRKAVAEAEKPMSEAKRSFSQVSAAADDARNAYREAKDDATERQRAMKEQISAQEKAKREQVQVAEDAQAEANDAQALIDEANDIHAHPDVTQTIAARLEADRAEREQQAAEVEQLASVERTVRERTRGSRTKFIAAIVGIVVVVAAIIIAVVVLMNR